MNFKAEYTTKEFCFKFADASIIIVAYEDEEYMIPRVCLSWKSDNAVDEFSRNQDVDLEVVNWKLSKLGID